MIKPQEIAKPAFLLRISCGLVCDSFGCVSKCLLGMHIFDYLNRTQQLISAVLDITAVHA